MNFNHSDSSNKTISVIIPCLNAANTICQQLDALCNQSLPPLEVIVADNGSTDGSQAMIEQYKNRLPKLQLIDASGQRGASHARNKGGQVAMGEYLAFCDADDIVSKHWIAALTDAFNEHDFVASCFDYQRLNPTANSTVQASGLQNFRVPFLPFAGGCGLGVKRQLHEMVNGFDESMTHLEDVDYCLRIQLLGTPLAFVQNAIVYIRYPTSDNHSFLTARKASFRHGYNWGNGLAKVYKRYKANGMYLHGLTIRLGLCVLGVLRCIFSGLSCDRFWRLGWDWGVLKGFFENRIFQL
jgi:glycosyltransferase involved in cell wall biosynthesis